MIRKIVLETIGFLLLALFLALLYHWIFPSGISITRNRPAVSPSSYWSPGPGGERYGA